MTSSREHWHESPEILLVVGSIPARGTKSASDLRFYCFGQVRRGDKSRSTHVIERKVDHVFKIFGIYFDSTRGHVFQSARIKLTEIRGFPGNERTMIMTANNWPSDPRPRGIESGRLATDCPETAMLD